jgi:hypothetical protein
MSLFWRHEFSGGFKTNGNFVHSCCRASYYYSEHTTFGYGMGGRENAGCIPHFISNIFSQISFASFALPAWLQHDYV